MRKKIICGLLVIVAVAGGIWLFNNYQKAEDYAVADIHSSSAPQPEMITLSRTTAEIQVGEEFPLNVQGIATEVKWSSDNESVATVDDYGVVKAVKKGTANIIADVDGEKLRCDVNVITLNDSEAVTSAIENMSVEEKVGQMFYVACPADAESALSEYHFGGYILFGGDFEGKSQSEISDRISGIQSKSKIPLIIGVDEEGGTVVRVSSNPALRETPFKSPSDVFTDSGWDGIKQDAIEKADLLLSLGINVNMAPVCDVTSEENAFMSDRSFSGYVEEVCDFAELYVTTSKEKNMGIVLKHFPGYGNSDDTHTGIVYDERPFSDFENNDFKPFQVGINSGADCVLLSHNIVKSMDEKMPASLSGKVVEILRNQLDFQGVIMTDDLAMGAITDFCGEEKSAVSAVKAGNDMLCCSGDIENQYNAVVNAVKKGEIKMEQIDASVERILNWKCNLGLI